MSIRFASAGTGAAPALPIAVIFPPEMMIVWSAFAAAPVPSITRTCSSAITGDCTRMKSLIVGCGCGWAKHLIQLTTIRAMSKRRIEEASSGSGTMQHKWEGEAMQAGAFHRKGREGGEGSGIWY